MNEPGCVGFSNNTKGILPRLIRWFTRSSISHTFLTTEPIAGHEAVQEASMVVQVVPFQRFYRDSATEAYWVYRIKPEWASEEVKRSSLSKVFSEYAGASYGRLQLLWFVWRSLNELVGRDVSHERNWFTAGLICSELVYDYLCGLGPEFESMLSTFNPDTVQAEDIGRIVASRSDVFELVEEKTLPAVDEKGQT